MNRSFRRAEFHEALESNCARSWRLCLVLFFLCDVVFPLIVGAVGSLLIVGFVFHAIAMLEFKWSVGTRDMPRADIPALTAYFHRLHGSVEPHGLTRLPSHASPDLIHIQRLVTPLEEMAVYLVPRVEPLRVGPLQPLHPDHQVRLRRFQQQVVMIAHEHKRVNHPPVFSQASAKHLRNNSRSASSR